MDQGNVSKLSKTLELCNKLKVVVNLEEETFSTGQHKALWQSFHNSFCAR